MKKEISMLIIGILIGAIISTGVFLILKGNQSDQMSRGEVPGFMDGNSTNGGRMRDNSNENSNLVQEDTTNSNEIDS